MKHSRVRLSEKIVAILFFAGVATAGAGCADRNSLPLNVELGTRSVSKLPFVIAEDQGLYEKYGLDVDLRMPAPKTDDAISTHDTGLSADLSQRIRGIFGGGEPWQRDIFVDGLTPNMVKLMDQAGFPHLVAIAGIDCVARAHIVAGDDVPEIEDLRGKRLGISARRDTTTGFVALVLAERMGWDPVQDISIKLNGRNVESLNTGDVDAIVASEMRYAEALAAGYRSLLDTRDWNVAIAGNSVMVEKDWLTDATNRDAARRFLKATIEGLALFHNDRELAVDVLARWHGITDPDMASIIYSRGQWLARTPYPCYDGIRETMRLYDSNEMRRYGQRDFFDDALLRELVDEGFVDAFY